MKPVPSLSRYLNSWSRRSGVPSLKSSLYTWQCSAADEEPCPQRRGDCSQHAGGAPHVVSPMHTGRLCDAILPASRL